MAKISLREGVIRFGIVIFLLLFLVFLFSDATVSLQTSTPWTSPLVGKTITLDAGHGGIDGGAVGRQGVIEKDLNLAIVLYLRDYLQEAGAAVRLTREGDYDLAESKTKGTAKRKTQDLLRREYEINHRQANLVVSIHMNSMPSRRWFGAQTFYGKSNESGKRLALAIQSELRAQLGSQRRARQENTVYLLKQLKMPTALVEVGFVSNPKEARLLSDARYQKKVAATLYRGILKFYNEKSDPAPMLP